MAYLEGLMQPTLHLVRQLERALLFPGPVVPVPVIEQAAQAAPAVVLVPVQASAPVAVQQQVPVARCARSDVLIMHTDCCLDNYDCLLRLEVAGELLLPV